jgi:uncharacterized membrane protein
MSDNPPAGSSPPTKQSTTTAIHQIALAVLVLFIGFSLRLYRLDAQPLSGDEAFSVINWGQTPLNDLLGRIALIDPQPPLTLLSFHGWARLTGYTEFAARMLSTLASTTTIALAYRLGCELGSKKIGLISAILCTINPYQIWYAQDARSYSLWMTTSALTSWTFLAFLRRPDRTRRAVAYSLASATSLYTFYLEGFLLIAQNIHALCTLRKHRRHLFQWLLSQVGIALLLSPWLLRPELWRSEYQPTAGKPDITLALQTLLLGNTLPTSLQTPLKQPIYQTISPGTIIAVILLVASFTTLWLSRYRKGASILTLLSLAPVVLLSALTILTGKGYFRARYISASSLPLIMATAFMLATLEGKKLYKAAGTMIALGIVILNGVGIWHYHFDPQFAKAPNWQGIVRILDEQTTTSDLIIRNFPDPAFDYYYNGNTPYTILPAQANANPTETTQALEAIYTQYSHLWFLPIESPAWDRDRVVATWLSTNAQFISEQWIGTTHLLQYASWEADARDIANHTSLTFGNLARLSGYRITPLLPRWGAGETVYLELFWTPLGQSEESLTVFVHVLGPPNPEGSPLWAQDDHPPQNGRLSTRDWTSGELYRDVYKLALPVNMDASQYTVTVGFYNPQTGQRLTLSEDIPQANANEAILFSFHIPPP